MIYSNPIVIIFLFINFLFGILALINPKRGFFVLIAITPFADLVKRMAFIYEIPSKNEINILVGAPDLIIVGIYMGLLIKIVLKEKRLSFRPKEKLILLLFLLWCFIKIFWSDVPIISNLATFKLWLLYVPLFIFAPMFIITKHDVKKILKIVLIIAILVSFYGLFQILNGLLPFEKRWSESGYSFLHPDTYFMYGILRPFSTFSSGDAYSYYLVFTLFFMPLIFQKRVVFFSVIQIFILMSLILTFVRTSIILFALLLFLSFFYSKYRAPRVKIISITLLILTSTILLNYTEPIFYSLFEKQREFENPYIQRMLTVGTYSARVAGRSYLIENFNEKTILGHGLSAAGIGRVATARFEIGTEVGELAYVHDAVSEFIVTIGVIGFTLFILFFIFLFKELIWGIELYIKDKFWKEFVFKIIIFTTGVLVVVSLSGGSFWGLRPVVVLFWSMLGVASSIINKFKIKLK